MNLFIFAKLLVILCVVFSPSLVFGQRKPDGSTGGKNTLVTTASWQTRDGLPISRAPLHEFLTSKQRSMIDSGFPTFSSLAVAILNPGETSISEEDVIRRAVYQVDCSVTFDTWEERYDLEKLTGQLGQQEIKSFANYADECLTGFIGDSANTEKLIRGGTLVGSLMVKQTSPEETAKIKAWLVRQQSGLMQGLFSHMLGELALNATANVVIRVPEFNPSTVKKSGE